KLTEEELRESIATVAIIDRRILIAGASVAASAAVLLPAIGTTRALAADAPIAETTSAKIRGVAVDGINAFKRRALRRAERQARTLHAPAQTRAVDGGAQRLDMRRSRRPTANSGLSLRTLRAPATLCRRAKTA